MKWTLNIYNILIIIIKKFVFELSSFEGSFWRVDVYNINITTSAMYNFVERANALFKGKFQIKYYQQ